MAQHGGFYMPKAYVVFRYDRNNVGDIASDPLQYFMHPSEYEKVDIVALGRTSFNPGVPVIAGGGGLLANEFIDDALRDLTVSHDRNAILNLANEFWSMTAAANKDVRDEFFSKLSPLVAEYVNKLDNTVSPRILWGAGHNGPHQKRVKGYLEYPVWLRNFDLVGIRDYGQEHEWVPCASCMHPALQEKHQIKHDIIWFEHKKQILKSTDFGTDPVPRFVNSGNNIEETIRLLGSANTIITNSYHGAYWGTLLGKKVIVVEAWSSKFNAMRHKPFFLSKGAYYKDFLKEIPVYPRALGECIEATEKYWAKVKEYL